MDNNNNFTWDPVLGMYRCPAGNEPERFVISRIPGKVVQKAWYPTVLCDRCHFSSTCRGKAKQKLYQTTIENESRGVQSISEFFFRFPFAQAQQSMIEFSYDSDMNLLGRVKSRTFDIGLKHSECQRLLSFLNRCRIVYTDGSHKDGDCSSSYMMIDCHNNVVHKTVSYRGNGSDSFISELLAAISIVNDICNSNDVSFCEIRSDNSAVVDIGNGTSLPKIEHPYAVELKSAIRRAQERNIEIVFVKVKGHSGEPGNEFVDFMAGYIRRSHPTSVAPIWNILPPDELIHEGEGTVFTQQEISTFADQLESEYMFDEFDECDSFSDECEKNRELDVKQEAKVMPTNQEHTEEEEGTNVLKEKENSDLKEQALTCGEEKSNCKSVSSNKSGDKASTGTTSDLKEKSKKQILALVSSNYYAIGYKKTKKYFVKGTQSWKVFISTLKNDNGRMQEKGYIVFPTKKSAKSSGFKLAGGES